MPAEFTMDGDQITADTTAAGTGISGFNSACSNNTVVNFATSYSSCAASVDNISLP
jgi:hypothetical protein